MLNFFVEPHDRVTEPVSAGRACIGVYALVPLELSAVGAPRIVAAQRVDVAMKLKCLVAGSLVKPVHILSEQIGSTALTQAVDRAMRRIYFALIDQQARLLVYIQHRLRFRCEGFRHRIFLEPPCFPDAAALTAEGRNAASDSNAGAGQNEKPPGTGENFSGSPQLS